MKIFVSEKNGFLHHFFIVRTNTSATDLESLINWTETELLNQNNKLKLLNALLGEALMQLIIRH
jgi:hypothetical protein